MARTTKETMMTKKATRPVEIHEGCAYQYPTHDGTLCLGDWGPEFSDHEQAFTVSLSLEDMAHPNIAQVGLTIAQTRALIDRLEEAIEPFESAVLVDPRPTPECPSWCNHHRVNLDGMHFGRIVVNKIEIEVQWDESDPTYGDPRVDVWGYEWINGHDLTGMAEALHIAERLLSNPGAAA